MSEYINMSQDELTELQHLYDTNARYCECCGKAIWYETIKVNNKFHKNKKISYNSATMYNTYKIIDGVRYDIKLCQHCLKEKDPEYNNIKNFSKVFNTLNKHVHYAFGVPFEILHKARQKQVPTLENMIRNYGEELGRIKWKKYCEKQALVNSFEYKKEKYGWTEEDFEKYNKSRAVTKNNLISKYGEELGNKKYEEYVNKQKLTKSKEYVVNKYGLLYWEQLCAVKGFAKDAYIAKYGEIEGLKKYKEHYDAFKKSHQCSYSVSANLFFNSLILENKDIFKHLTIYYAGNENYEYSVVYNDKCYWLDFYLKEINLNIEFFGDYWHQNPKLYDKSHKNNTNNCVAEEIWKKDKQRINDLKECGIETFVIWESEKDDINKKEEIVKLINDKKIKYGIL